MVLVPALETARDARLGEHVERNIRAGSYGQQESLAVGGERDVPGPVMRPQDVADDVLGFAARGQVAAAVGKPDHAVTIRDIDPLGIRPERIEGDPVGLRQPGREHFILQRLAGAARHSQHAHLVGAAFGEEEIAVRCGADHARNVQAGRHHLDREARRNFRHGTTGIGDHLGERRAIGPDGRHILGGKQPAYPGLVLPPVPHGLLAFQQWPIRRQSAANNAHGQGK